MDKTNYHYGVIGNCRTAALIDKQGSIDWLCLPEMDSTSVFARILDEKNGGSFTVEVGKDYQISQAYIKRTNILKTCFKGPDGAFELIDFCPRYKLEGKMSRYHCPPEVMRLFRVHSGKPKIRIRYEPKLIYGRSETKSAKNGNKIKSFSRSTIYESIYFYSSFAYDDILENREITLERDHYIALSYHQKIITPDLDSVYLDYEKTKVYWLDWVNKTAIFPKYNEAIVRSALVLKLMTYQTTGAVMAALTTSLPEHIGGERNWDYRYCWLRDASMTISIFADLGHDNSVRHFIKYILGLISTKDERIQIMYGIRGKRYLREENLDHLAGYLGSKPVRIGNAAYLQKQNDIYGILLDVIFKSLDFLDYKFGGLDEIWTIVRTLVRNVEKHWPEPDRGIWEFRGKEEHFLFSKVLSWVALDRGVRIARRFGMDEYIEEWSAVRDAIKAEIHEKGWNEEVGAFTQHYGSKKMDSANLLMNDYGFISADDPRFVATVEQTHKELCHNGLMYRYKDEDDFGKPQSAFTVCSFWMVECLFKIGREKEAEEMFEGLVNSANHVGLLSEDMDFDSRRLLGNFPQAYSHLALISAAELLGSRTRLEDSDWIINRIIQD